MGMGPRVQTREQRSQATPLADDVLRMIRGQLASGRAGSGFSPLQQQAGTAIQQYINSGGINAMPVVRDIGPAGADFGRMVSALETVQNRRVDEQAANLREQAGAAGTRYGTTLGAAEGAFRRDAQADFNVTLEQLAVALDEARRADETLGIQRDLSLGQLQQSAEQFNQQRMLEAITTMFGMGQQNMAPIFALAQMGILPEHLMVSPGVGSQILSGIMSGASAMLPVAGQFLLNRRQQTPSQGTPIPYGSGALG